MKRDKIIYWVATTLMCLLFAFSAGMYFLNYPRISEFFTNLGFPIWLIYPLAILKVLGIIAVLSKKSLFLKEMAYAGFLFDAILALTAHLMVNDGEFMPATLGIVFILVSWIFDRRVYGNLVQGLKD